MKRTRKNYKRYSLLSVSTLNAFIILFTGINPQKAHACKELDFTLNLKEEKWNNPQSGELRQYLMLDNLPVQREDQRAQEGNPPPQPPKAKRDRFKNSLLRCYMVPREEEITESERSMFSNPMFPSFAFPSFLWGIWPDLTDVIYDSSRNMSVILEIIVDRPYEVLDENIIENSLTNYVCLQESQEGINSLYTIFRISKELLVKHIPHAIWRFLTDVIGEDSPCGTGSMSFVVCLVPESEEYRVLLPNLSLRDNEVKEGDYLRFFHSSFTHKKILQEAKDHVLFEPHRKRKQLEINNYRNFLSMRQMDIENDKMTAGLIELDEFPKKQNAIEALNTTNLGEGAHPEKISEERLPVLWEEPEEDENDDSQDDSQDDKGDK